MAKRTRRNYTGTFKAKVAVVALRGDKTLTKIAQQYEVHPNQLTEWKRQLLERAADVFSGEGAGAGPEGTARQDSSAGAGNRAFKRRAHQSGIAERNEMVDRTHDLPVSRQCRILALSRSTAYYRHSWTAISTWC
jgi:putative transposase